MMSTDNERSDRMLYALKWVAVVMYVAGGVGFSVAGYIMHPALGYVVAASFLICCSMVLKSSVDKIEIERNNMKDKKRKSQSGMAVGELLIIGFVAVTALVYAVSQFGPKPSDTCPVCGVYAPCYNHQVTIK